MELWDQILQTVMLGTAKKKFEVSEESSILPKEIITQISENKVADQEDRVLHYAALAFNYRQCGNLPDKKENLPVYRSEAEEQQYCNLTSAQLLSQILSEDFRNLLELWLFHCEAKKLIVPPSQLPDLMNAGIKYKDLRETIISCSGKRGAWLRKFNVEWNYFEASSTEDDWETGNWDQRKKLFIDFRLADPVHALEKLKKVWPSEDAATKLKFLELFHLNPVNSDIPFLEEAAKEKGKKIRTEVFEILKRIPGSAIVKSYEQELKKHLHRKEGFLFSGKKIVIEFKEPVPKEIFDSGIEKLSNQKNFSDEEYIIFQLLSNVPPGFMESNFGGKFQDQVEILQKDSKTGKLLPALVRAILKFGDKERALILLQNSESFFAELIPMLPPSEQEAFTIKNFDQDTETLIGYALQRKAVWNPTLTKTIFQYTASRPYQYNRQFYTNCIQLLPSETPGLLDACTPKEEYNKQSWNNTSDFIFKLMSIKLQTIQSFKS